jgi:hypothetical protein
VDKAQRIGLVDAVLEAEDRFPGEHRFFHAVRQHAARLLERPARRSSRPVALRDRFLDGTRLGRFIVARMAERNLDRVRLRQSERRSGV